MPPPRALSPEVSIVGPPVAWPHHPLPRPGATLDHTPHPSCSRSPAPDTFISPAPCASIAGRLKPISPLKMQSLLLQIIMNPWTSPPPTRLPSSI